MYGMTDLEESSWTQITDSDLNRIVQEIQELTPNVMKFNDFIQFSNFGLLSTTVIILKLSR